MSASPQCPRGHSYDDANTAFTREGWRYCRECRRATARTRKSYSFSLIESGRVAIYVLCDPRTERVRYVGQTVNPTSRLIAHRGDSLKEMGFTSAQNCWMRELHDAGLRPTMHILETVPVSDAAAREQYHIRAHRAAGCELVNTMHMQQTAKTIWAALQLPQPLREKIEALAEERLSSVRQIITDTLSDALE